MRVGEICNREVVIVEQDKTVTEAATIMREYHVGDVIVCEQKYGSQIPVEIVQRELKKDRFDVQATAQVMLAEAVRLIGQDELEEAVTVLKNAHRMCSKVGMKNAWVSPLLPWLA